MYSKMLFPTHRSTLPYSMIDLFQLLAAYSKRLEHRPRVLPLVMHPELHNLLYNTVHNHLPQLQLKNKSDSSGDGTNNESYLSKKPSLFEIKLNIIKAAQIYSKNLGLLTLSEERCENWPENTTCAARWLQVLAVDRVCVPGPLMLHLINDYDYVYKGEVVWFAC